MNQVLDRLVQHAQHVVRSGAVVLWEQRDGALVKRVSVGPRSTREAGGATLRAWQTGALAQLDDGDESTVAVPVFARAGQPVGVLEFSGRTPDLNLAQALASACGVVLDAPATTDLLTQLPLAAWVRDEAGRFTFANPAFALLLGRPVAAILGQPAAALFPAHESATSTEADRRLLSERTTHHFEFSCGAAGRTFWVSRFLVTQPNGTVGLGGVVLEITASATVEATLRTAEARLRDVFDLLHDAVFIERDGVLLFANQTLATALGEPSVPALIGTPWRRFLADDTATDQLRLRRRDGSVGVFERSALQVDYEGRAATAVILRDVTAQRLREEQLTLTARLASVGTLAATVAHEINNPLAFMMTNLHLIAQDLRGMATRPLAPQRLNELIGLVDDASHGVERIRRLVRAMGSLARDTERQPTQAIALAPVIDNALQLTSTEVRLRARLELSVGRLPQVDADETQLSQVLVNLLINAAQAIAPGNAEAHRVQVIAFTGPRGQAIIEVRDDGEGIAPELRARIFEPFFTTKPVRHFTGLGLSIARGIVESFKGELTVDSQPGVGTTFRVALPPSASARAETTPLVVPEAAAQPTAGKRGRVLIIDDEPLIGKVLARGLRELHDTVVVHSAREALAQLGQGGFDAVISDVMMPGMDGVSFFAEVERRFPAMAARTVFISGGTFTPGTRELLDRLPNPCLEKPLDLKRLMALIDGLVENGPFAPRRE